VPDTEPTTISAYIASFPDDVRAVLANVRQAILGAVPDADEQVSYGIAAITVGGAPLLYFAGWKRHISVYPAPAGDADFDRAAAPYRSGRSTLKFPLDQPVPYDLIAQAARLHLAHRGSAD
jgi:uncharacterized protein YdhG (YjbR/CyaY superfamily)